jgi:hypothetical protein
MNLFNEIAKVAYELYEKNGYIQSRDLDHWIEAEKIVIARLAEEEKKKEEKKIKSEKKPVAEEEKKREKEKVQSEKKPPAKTKKTAGKKKK